MQQGQSAESECSTRMEIKSYTMPDVVRMMMQAELKEARAK